MAQHARHLHYLRGGLVLKWAQAHPGLAEIERPTVAKAKLLYDALDAAASIAIRWPGDRSRMTCPHAGGREARPAFLKGAEARAWCSSRATARWADARLDLQRDADRGRQALVEYMREFEKQHG